MSKKTEIQWCDSTVNPTMGCDGCELWNKLRKTCYAGLLHTRFGGVTKGYAPTFEHVTLFPGRMAEAAQWSDLTGTKRDDKPWLNGIPRTIFVSDMSDSLSKVVPFEYLETEVIANVVSDLGLRHQWLWLTKRPDRMSEFSAWLKKRGTSWPSNLWAGTSITTQTTTSRIDKLLNVGDGKTIRFLSVEPQIEAIKLGKWLRKLDWVIQGGESGHRARPFDVEWAIDLIAQCELQRVPYFLKQLGSKVVRDGKPLSFKDNHAGDWDEWPKLIRVRQMPAVTSSAVSDTRVSLPTIIRQRKDIKSMNGEILEAQIALDQLEEVESFQIGLPVTLPPDQPGQIISYSTFVRFVFQQLKKAGGVMPEKALDKAIRAHFEPLLGKSDRHLDKKGAEQWVQLIASAKAVLTDQGICPVAKYPMKKGGRRYRVLVTPRTEQKWKDAIAYAHRLRVAARKKRRKPKKKYGKTAHYRAAQKRNILPK